MKTNIPNKQHLIEAVKLAAELGEPMFIGINKSNELIRVSSANQKQLRMIFVVITKKGKIKPQKATLNEKFLSAISYQDITKLFKMVTGKAFTIGTSKQELVKKLKSKTFQMEVPDLSEPKPEKDLRAPITREEAIAADPAYLTIMRSRKLAGYHKSASTLKRVVKPTKALVEAAWNLSLPVPITADEKVLVTADQDGVKDGYVRVSHGEKYSHTQVLDVRHFYNKGDEDPSEVEERESKRIKEELDSLYR